MQQETTTNADSAKCFCDRGNGSTMLAVQKSSVLELQSGESPTGRDGKENDRIARVAGSGVLLLASADATNAVQYKNAV